MYPRWLEAWLTFWSNLRVKKNCVTVHLSSHPFLCQLNSTGIAVDSLTLLLILEQLWGFRICWLFLDLDLNIDFATVKSIWNEGTHAQVLILPQAKCNRAAVQPGAVADRLWAPLSLSVKENALRICLTEILCLQNAIIRYKFGATIQTKDATCSQKPLLSLSRYCFPDPSYSECVCGPVPGNLLDVQNRNLTL